MKTTVFFLCFSVIPYVVLSQQLHNYKTYIRPIKGCRNSVEKILLFSDSSFIVSSCIGGIGTQYRGGWWIKDSLLILQPSQNCKAPRLISMEESQDKKQNDISIEVYNENGKLIHYSIINGLNMNVIYFEKGCVLIEVKKRLIHRCLHFAIKGKKLSPIITKKKNNKIIIIIFEPYSSKDIYLGIQEIPLSSLIETQ